MPVLFKMAYPILVTLFLFLSPFLSSAQIQVNSVSATPITCPNNGKITVNATTASPPLLYSIVAGPVLQPVQTNPVFSSLLPGNYTIKITDGAGNETTVNASITGTYQNPDFTISDTTPYCVGESNGQLVGAIIPGKGLAPFSWQLIAPSPVTTGLQTNGLFQNLPAGNYSMRITDACGSFSTNTFVLNNPDTRFGFLGNNPIDQEGSFTSAKVGCDSMLITYWLNIPNPRMPLNFKYLTSNGVFIPTSGTTIDSSAMDMTGMVMVSQIIPGLDYGDMVSARIYNTCGDSAVSMSIVIHPFVFSPKYSFNDCGSTANVVFTNTTTYDYHTSIIPNATYSLTHVPSNAIVASGTITAQYNNGYVPITPTIVSGQTYRFTITDRCGQTFQDDFTVPASAPPLIIHEDIVSAACIDSVLGTYRVITVGFGPNAKLIVLSGPSTLGSTKSGFEYTDTYIYPDTVRMVNGESFLMNNLTDGTYHFKIIDDCGNEILSSITITPEQLTSLQRVTSFEKGCLNRNKIFFSMVSGGNVIIRNIGTNTVLTDRDFEPYTDNNQALVNNRDSLLNLPDGTYEITYQYLQLIGVFENGKALNESQTDCWKIIDTVVIDPYAFPEMTTFNSIMCNDVVHFVLIPDSTKGVPPYQYEIISGPQTFPVQASNIFTTTRPGTYTARIFDVCGNASTKQITVDTIAFDPIEVHVTCSNTSMYFPSSPYAVYEWLMPNNQTYVGDSLILDPVTPSDTGTYHISKIININGCTDTLTATYHVPLQNLRAQTIPFCAGTEVHVGLSIYDAPGIYHDTLTSVAGCDSIIITTLRLLPQHSDTLHVSICPQESYLFGGISYENSGFYNDTLSSTQGCDSIRVLHLTLRSYIQNTITRTICSNESFNFGGRILTTSGSYRDTLQTVHCDSIVTLNLTVLPSKYTTINKVICQGNHFAMGGNNYSLSGTYKDTLLTATCDSIITLNLTVQPYKYNAITRNICHGNSYTVGDNTYTLSGIYTDTLSTTTCDSIVTLTLNISPGTALSTHLAAFYCYQTGIVPLSPTPAGGTLTGDFVTGTGLDLTAATPGSYSITYSYTDANGCISTLTKPFLVTAPLVPDFIYSSDCFQKATFINMTQPVAATTTYSWSFTNGGETSTAVNPNITYDQSGDHIVTMIATDSYNCSYQVIKPISITEGVSEDDFVIPNVITANGDGVNDVLSISATLEECIRYKILILNRWGNLVYEMDNAQNAFSGLDKGGGELTPGVYFYIVESDDIDCKDEYKGFCSGTITIVR